MTPVNHHNNNIPNQNHQHYQYQQNQNFNYPQPILNHPGSSVQTPPVMLPNEPRFFPFSFVNPQKKTTVFVGSIDRQAPDEMIIRMLRTCGAVADWKRASGANGTMQPFGFVKFEDFESTLRAIRVMHNLKIGEKQLIVKLSAEDQQKLDKYKKDKHDYLIKTGQQIVSAFNWQNQNEKSESELAAQGVKEVLTQEEVQHDKSVALKLKTIVKEYDDYFKNPLLHQSVSQNFLRSTMAKHMQTRDLRNGAFNSTEFVEQRTKEIDMEANDVKNKLSLKSGPDVENDISDDSTSENLTANLTKKSDSTAARLTYNDEQGNDISDPITERKMYLRKLKEKAKAYSQILKRYEARERRQQRNYIYEENEVETSKINYTKSYTKELNFYSEYNDETMDKKHYYSRRFAYKISEREFESKNDKELLRQLSSIHKNKYYPKFIQHTQYIRENIAKKYFSNTKNTSQHSDINQQEPRNIDHQIMNENELKLEYSQDSSNMISGENNLKSAAGVALIDKNNFPTPSEIKDQVEKETDSLIERMSIGTSESSPSIQSTSQLKINLSNSLLSKKGGSEHSQHLIAVLGVGGIFDSVFDLNSSTVHCNNKNNSNTVANVEATSLEKKYKYDSDLENLNRNNGDSNCETIYSILESIPLSNQELFKLNIDWSEVSSNLVQKYVYPWLSKKVTEYLGEPEKALIELICEKLESHSSPGDMVESLAVVLDEQEAKNFTANLWRLVLYILKAIETKIL